MPYLKELHRSDLRTYRATPREREFHELSRYLAAVLNHRWVFASIVGGFVVLVFIITLLTPKSYTTTVRLMAGNPGTQSGGNTNLPILNALLLQTGDQSAETFATLAQQEGVAALVIAQERLNVSAGALLDHVTVSPVSNTPILNLSVTWQNPETSARIANAFGQAFMTREREFVQSQAVAAMGFLSQELPRAEARMQQAATALANYQAQNGFVDAGNHTQDVVAHATQLDGKIEATTLDSREARALLANVQRQLATLPETVNTAQQISVNPVLADLQSKLESVDVQLKQAEQQYTDSHPLVVSLRKQHQILTAQIAHQPARINSQNTLSPNPVYQALQQQAAQYKQRLDADAAQLDTLQRQRVKLTPVLQSLPQKSMQLATLQQRAKLASDVYSALEQKYSDATIARTTALSDISVVQSATASSALVRPNLRINVLAALIVGIILGSIVVIIMDALEHRVRSSNADARILGLPLIARIPAFAPVSRTMLPWVQSMTVEAFLHLCVSLRLKQKHPLRTLAISSPCRGDGKSTVAFNLGKAMATLEPRVLLIDADMRRPTLHQMANCSNDVGLSDVLSGGHSLSECVHEIAPNLDLLASGKEPGNPVSLLRASQFDELIKTASQGYAMVIVDTPALASVTDSLLVSARVDGTVLVIAENTTDESEAKRVIAELSAVGINNVLGIVLNMDTKRVTDYSDYFVTMARGNVLPGA
jgi:capsular exopolysaccharide synthesis family protein